MPFHHTMSEGTTAVETPTGTYIIDDPTQSSIFEASTQGNIIRTIERGAVPSSGYAGTSARQTAAVDFAAGEWEAEGGDPLEMGKRLISEGPGWRLSAEALAEPEYDQPFWEAEARLLLGEPLPVQAGGLVTAIPAVAARVGPLLAAGAVAVDKVGDWLGPGFEVSDIWEEPGQVLGDLARGAVEELIGFDFGDADFGTTALTTGGDMAHTQMVQKDFPGAMDIVQSIIDLVPGGDQPGESAVKRALGHWLGPIMITAGPTSNRWGGWNGSYIRHPSDKRKRGFFVDMRGPVPIVKTWRYERMAVISSNPRVKSVARAARIVDDSVSDIVKVAKVADRAESKLKGKRRRR
jgi:hypothetical protein